MLHLNAQSRNFLKANVEKGVCACAEIPEMGEQIICI